MFNEVYIDDLRAKGSVDLYRSLGDVPDELCQTASKPKKSYAKYLGRFMFFAGVIGILLTVSPMVVDEINLKFRKDTTNQLIIESRLVSPQKNFSGIPLDLESMKAFSPVDTNFGLIIPKIKINAPVLAGVDPTNQVEYDAALTRGVAQAKGTAFPGEGKSIFIFGHSSNYIWDTSKYRTAFYLLKNLNKTDKVIVTYENKLYLYQVQENKIVDGNDTSYLKPEDGERLVLSTCWPPGSNWKRLIIIASPLDLNEGVVANNSTNIGL